MRSAAKNEFEKKMIKLINYVVIGKTMGNVRKRGNIKLVTKWTRRYGAGALIAKPNFKARSILDVNLVSIKFGQVQVLLNKTFYMYNLKILSLQFFYLFYFFIYSFIIFRFIYLFICFFFKFNYL